jgi:hypothetical protein
MLIAFRLQNFRSFLDEQTFTFASSPDRTHEATHCIRTGVKSIPRISKSALIFGPNASGKTNLLIALATLRDLILHSTSYSDGRLGEWYTPFRFGPSADQPVSFEIDVLLNGVRYRYAVSYDSTRVTSERLLVFRSGKSQRWFERRFSHSLQREEWAPFSPNFNGPREMWRKATRPQALFLTAATQLNSEQLAPLLHWLEHGLEVVFPSDAGEVGRMSAYIKNDAFKGRLLTLLKAVDIPVDDVRVVEPDTESVAARVSTSEHLTHETRPAVIEFLYARQGWLPVWLNSGFEAAGTHRLFALFGPLLAAMEKGKLLLVDEFDTGLHPLVARFLIQLINDPQVSKRGAQLLLVSHNTTLMDLDILRRDEIWLMQLDDARASNLLPLLRSSPRKRELIAKSYLKGAYGAVPRIQSELREIRAMSDRSS